MIIILHMRVNNNFNNILKNKDNGTIIKNIVICHSGTRSVNQNCM